jgi:hypothetical protein
MVFDDCKRAGCRIVARPGARAPAPTKPIGTDATD